MLFKENKTLSPYFGVSKRSKTFFVDVKNKERTKKKFAEKKIRPFFLVLTIGRLFS
jgi:hypothetical protein